VGMGRGGDAAFSITTILTRCTTGVKIPTGCALCGAAPSAADPRSYFSLLNRRCHEWGGLSGVMHASPPWISEHTYTYFVVAHFHSVLFGGSIFGLFCGVLLLVAQDHRQILDERLGKCTSG